MSPSKAPSPSTRALARRLLADCGAAADPLKPEAFAVIERLRLVLHRFAGPDGFSALLRRAVVLAAAETSELRGVKVEADGRLAGCEHLVAGSATTRDEAAAAITTHLLGLLAAFIGESLTLTLLRGAWPDTALIDGRSNAGTE